MLYVREMVRSRVVEEKEETGADEGRTGRINRGSRNAIELTGATRVQ